MLTPSGGIDQWGGLVLYIYSLIDFQQTSEFVSSALFLTIEKDGGESVDVCL